MRPVLLDMDGFASFRDQATVDFTDADYFALVGPTGSGKSTVIDAMTFALYGSVAALGQDKRDGHVRAGPDRGPRHGAAGVRRRTAALRRRPRAAAGQGRRIAQQNARLERLVDPPPPATRIDEPTESMAADRGRDRRRSRSCSGWPSSTSASASCCRRASSPSSCSASAVRAAGDPAQAARRRALRRHRQAGGTPRQRRRARLDALSGELTGMPTPPTRPRPPPVSGRSSWPRCWPRSPATPRTSPGCRRSVRVRRPRPPERTKSSPGSTR